MKLLLDTCVSPRTRDELRAAGHDVVWVGDWPDDPGDEVILETAHREGRVLITLDKDFGELVVVFGRKHAGIIRFIEAGCLRKRTRRRRPPDRRTSTRSPAPGDDDDE